MLLLGNTGGAPLPSLAWTHEAKLFAGGRGLKWLMGKGQSRDIFGTKTAPTHPLSHTMDNAGGPQKWCCPGPGG